MNNNNISIQNQREQGKRFEPFVLDLQVEELKKSYDLKGFDNQTIKNAIIEANGDVEMTFVILSSMK